MRFLADSGLAVSVVPVSLYKDDAGRRLVDIESESEVTSGGPADHGVGSAKSQKSYMIDGHLVRIVDLVEEGLLPAGTEIELSRRGKAGRPPITKDGTIQIGDNVYSTPSAAGVPVVGLDRCLSDLARTFLGPPEPGRPPLVAS
jgi:hypothetical protein